MTIKDKIFHFLIAFALQGIGFLQGAIPIYCTSLIILFLEIGYEISQIEQAVKENRFNKLFIIDTILDIFATLIGIFVFYLIGIFITQG